MTSGTISSLVVCTVMELKYGGTATYLKAVSNGMYAVPLVPKPSASSRIPTIVNSVEPTAINDPIE